jgi:hypothetical protein
MEKSGIPVGGSNGREIQKQLENLAAARITLGVWDSEGARQETTTIARRLSFWIERDPNQGTLWQPEMELSEEYVETLREHAVPVDLRALVGLQANPRAMDLYLWLAYRLHAGFGSSSLVRIKLQSLHTIFGATVRDYRNFKVHFRKALKQALSFYPAARVDLESDMLILRPSPPAIEYNLTRGRLGARQRSLPS